MSIKCPTCKKRLFDISENCAGIVDIKCTHCKKLVKISLKPKPRSMILAIKRI